MTMDWNASTLRGLSWAYKKAVDLNKPDFWPELRLITLKTTDSFEWQRDSNSGLEPTALTTTPPQLPHQ